MEIDRNEIPDESARQGSSHPLIGPEPALHIYAKAAMGLIKDRTNRKHEEHWQSVCGQRQAKDFLKKTLCKRRWGITQLSRNQLRILTVLLTGHLLFKGHLSKMGLVNSPECDRCKQVSETASHILSDSEAMATLRFRHLDLHFMKPGAFEDISVSKILQFFSKCGTAE